jgi:hypothetical protein
LNSTRFFTKEKKMKKLSVVLMSLFLFVNPVAAFTDPFSSSSCSGTDMSQKDAAHLLPAGSTGVVIGYYSVYSRERDCNSVSGCSAWKAGSNSIVHKTFGYEEEASLGDGGSIGLIMNPHSGDLGIVSSVKDNRWFNCGTLPVSNCDLMYWGSNYNLGSFTSKVTNRCLRLTTSMKKLNSSQAYWGERELVILAEY